MHSCNYPLILMISFVCCLICCAPAIWAGAFGHLMPKSCLLISRPIFICFSSAPVFTKHHPRSQEFSKQRDDCRSHSISYGIVHLSMMDKYIVSPQSACKVADAIMAKVRLRPKRCTTGQGCCGKTLASTGRTPSRSTTNHVKMLKPLIMMRLI